jgi:hypothetical protein
LQFLAVLIHALQLFFYDCNYPRVFVYAIIGHALLFIGLFTDFYIKTYVKKPKVKVESDSGAMTKVRKLPAGAVNLEKKLSTNVTRVTLSDFRSSQMKFLDF